MRRSGTDVMALACVVGGGLIAGGVTLALAQGAALPSLECATTVGADTDVVVALGDEGVVVVRPDVRVREAAECMQADEGTEQTAQNPPIELRRLDAQNRNVVVARVDRARDEARREREQARREVEQARREAEQVRREVERVRERVRRRVTVEAAEVEERAHFEAQRALERAQRARTGDNERAERDRERAQAQLERMLQRMDAAQERAAEDRDRALERARDETIHLGEDGIALDGELLEGFTIDLPDRTFEFHFEGLENMDFDGLEDALRVQLEVLEGLELDFDGLDADLEAEIEQRIEQKIKDLEERLERIGEGSGR